MNIDYVYKLMLDEISTESFCDLIKPKKIDEYINELFSVSFKDENSVGIDISLYLYFKFPNVKADINKLSKLLTYDWHEKHDDVLRLILKSSSSISSDFIKESMSIDFKYMINDDSLITYRKNCEYALKKLDG